MKHAFITAIFAINLTMCSPSVNVDVDDVNVISPIASVYEKISKSTMSIQLENNSEFQVLAGVSVDHVESPYYVVTSLLSQYTYQYIHGVKDEQRFELTSIFDQELAAYNLSVVSFESTNTYTVAEFSSSQPSLGASVLGTGTIYTDSVTSHLVVGNIINTEVNILDIDYIQTSISFNPGYEGMGVFDLNAELVGLLTYKLPEINKQSLYLPIQTVADYLR